MLPKTVLALTVLYVSIVLYLTVKRSTLKGVHHYVMYSKGSKLWFAGCKRGKHY
jgi:hypothetical protein